MNENKCDIIDEDLKRKYLEVYLIENQKYLYRIAFSYVNNVDDAFEIVQNTIYKSLNHIKSLKDVNALKSWVSRILINSCFDFLKYNSKIILAEEIFENINDDNKNILDKIILKKAMDKLSYKLKMIIILRFFKGLKIKDISQILNMKENTVKTNLYKALNKLKIDLVRYEDNA